MVQPIWPQRTPNQWHEELSRKQLRDARRRAREHGRARPSLVDNIDAKRSS